MACVRRPRPCIGRALSIDGATSGENQGLRVAPVDFDGVSENSGHTGECSVNQLKPRQYAVLALAAALACFAGWAMVYEPPRGAMLTPMGTVVTAPEMELSRGSATCAWGGVTWAARETAPGIWWCLPADAPREH